MRRADRPEQALERSEATRAALAESSFDAVVLIDAAGRIMDVNGVAEGVLARPRDALVGRDAVATLASAQRPQPLREALAHALAAGAPARPACCDVARADGTVFPAELVAVSTGGPDPVLVVQIRDVTRTGCAAETAGPSAATVEPADLAIVGTDLDGTITSWNPAAERLYGYPAAEAVGRDLRMLARDAQEPERLLAALRAGCCTEPCEAEQRRADGTLVDVTLNVSPVRDASGRVIGGAVIASRFTAVERAGAAWRRTAQLHDTLVSLLDATVFECDTELRIVDAEGSLLSRLGVAPDELIGRTVWEVAPPALAERIAEHYRAALSGESRPLEWKCDADTTLDFDLVPLDAEAGAGAGVVVLVRDVSERKRIERDLRFEAEILDRLDVAVVATDPARRITHWNRAAETMFDRPRASVLGQDLAEMATDPAVDEMLTALANGGARQGEWALTRADGRRMRLYVTLDAVRDASGALSGFAGVVIDASTARRAAAELHAARSLFERAFESAPLGMALIDAAGAARGALLRVNQPLCRMLDLTPESFAGRGLVELVHRDDADRIRVALARLLDGVDGAFVGDVRLRGQLDRVVRGKLSVALIRDVDGAPRHAVALVEDVTEARQIQDENRELERRLHQAQKLDVIGRLAGGIAHDFNNLLTVISNYAALVLDELPLGGLAASYLVEIEEAAERASALTRQLLVFGRREVVQPTPIDVNAVIADLDRLLRRTIGEDVELRTRLAGDLRAVRADRSQLEQVLVNLTLNGRAAMPAGGVVTISTANVDMDTSDAARPAGLRPGRFVRVDVIDTGQGMPPEDVERAFEPFFTSKPPGEGTGLGLATVHSIVREAGGHVEIRSEPGKGTAVHVLLPACVEDAVAPAHPEAAPPPRGRGECLLLVEDDPAVRAIARRLLDDGGYHVLEASSPEEALRLGREDRVDMLVTDVVMPGMSGSELAASLLVRRPDLRVVFMSGYTDDMVTRRGVRERQMSFVEKPFTRATLLRRVREALDHPAQRGRGA